MNRYAIYNIETGLVDRFILSRPGNIEMQIRNGEAFLNIGSERTSLEGIWYVINGKLTNE